MLTTKTAAAHIASYLRHEITLAELVDWAEQTLMKEDFDQSEAPVLAQVLARVGLADVKTFGLTWDDCDELLHQLGFAAHVDVVPV